MGGKAHITRLRHKGRQFGNSPGLLYYVAQTPCHALEECKLLLGVYLSGRLTPPGHKGSVSAVGSVGGHLAGLLNLRGQEAFTFLLNLLVFVSRKMP